MNGLISKLLIAGVMVGGLAASSPMALAQSQEPAMDGEDRRAPVVLRPNEKTLVLNDMRQYLKGLQEMFYALAKNDMDTVSGKARELGRINIYETYLRFPNRAGVTFRELSAQVHEDFESIADSAQQKNANEIMKDLSMTMKHCVSCHQNYRLTEMSHSR